MRMHATVALLEFSRTHSVRDRLLSSFSGYGILYRCDEVYDRPHLFTLSCIHWSERKSTKYDAGECECLDLQGYGGIALLEEVLPRLLNVTAPLKVRMIERIAAVPKFEGSTPLRRLIGPSDTLERKLRLHA